MTGTPLSALGDFLAEDRLDDAPLVCAGKNSYSRALFQRHVSSLAAHLSAQPGEGWLIAEEDAWDVAVSLFALLHAGKRPVLPANHQEGHLAVLTRTVDGVITADLLTRTAERDAPPLKSFDPALAELVLHTSGSSGAPEAFTKPFHCLEAEVRTLHGTFAGKAPRHVLATVPAHHIYGLLFRILWPLAAGWTFERGMLRYPEDLPHALAAHEEAHLVSSPAFLKRAVEVLDWDAARALKGIFSSGGPLAPEVAAVYNTRLPQPLYEVYGSTETGGIGYRAVKDAANPPRWTPLSGVALSLGPESRLAVTSPHIPEGMFQTEDVAELFADGAFMLKGRADRIVKIEERRVSLTEIEKRLSALAGIKEARCIPLEGGTRLLLGVAAVLSEEGWEKLRADGKPAFAKGLRDHLSGHLPPASLPRKWRFISALPENTQGKVTEEALANLFEAVSGRRMAPQVLEENQTENGAQLRLVPGLPLSWFEGHFDIAPVLPGLAQLAWAVEEGRRLFGEERPVCRVEVVKFFDVVKPGTELTLRLSHEPEKNRLLFHYESAGGEHSKGRILFGGAA